MTVRRTRGRALAVPVLALGLTLAGCSDGDATDPGAADPGASSSEVTDGPDTESPEPSDAVGAEPPTETTADETTADETTDAAAETPDATSTSAPPTTAAAGIFGSGCGDLPLDEAGAIAGQADAAAADAAASVPALGTLTAALRSAGLADRLNDAEEVTLFAPTDDAFRSLGLAELQRALSDPRGVLTDMLSYHVVPEQLGPDELAGTHPTVEGSELTIEGSGEDFTVGQGAQIVCGNITTANATVYLIDEVLMPPQ